MLQAAGSREDAAVPHTGCTSSEVDLVKAAQGSGLCRAGAPEGAYVCLSYSELSVTRGARANGACTHASARMHTYTCMHARMLCREVQSARLGCPSAHSWTGAVECDLYVHEQGLPTHGRVQRSARARTALLASVSAQASTALLASISARAKIVWSQGGGVFAGRQDGCSGLRRQHVAQTSSTSKGRGGLGSEAFCARPRASSRVL